ncbi:ankyrin repeat domain-containing protein [Janthinobacterium sp. RT4P48]|uniref:ankyrin repeat domain-containing protein n=1 Tax=Janthinobacterium sp. RT4P48 TaxID=3424188 RepID=UPI003F29D4EE
MFALHAAIEQMDIKAARSLLEQGANVNARDPEVGMATALHIAVDIECEDACRRYDSGDADASPVPALTKLLLDFCADPSVPDAGDKTPRDWAVERNHFQAMTLFDSQW